jgi:general stress protein 26
VAVADLPPAPDGRPPIARFGAPGIFIAVEGTADIVRDRAQFEKHWSKDLERWLEQGIDTEGLVMLHVRATRIAYWDGEDEGDIVVG